MLIVVVSDIFNASLRFIFIHSVRECIYVYKNYFSIVYLNNINYTDTVTAFKFYTNTSCLGLFLT